MNKIVLSTSSVVYVDVVCEVFYRLSFCNYGEVYVLFFNYVCGVASVVCVWEFVVNLCSGCSWNGCILFGCLDAVWLWPACILLEICVVC